MIKPEDVLKALEEKDKNIKALERQIDACLVWIKNYTGVTMTIEDIVKSEDMPIEKLKENALTKLEMAQLVYSSIVLEEHMNMFNYGRDVNAREEKMAESL